MEIVTCSKRSLFMYIYWNLVWDWLYFLHVGIAMFLISPCVCCTSDLKVSLLDVLNCHPKFLYCIQTYHHIHTTSYIWVGLHLLLYEKYLCVWMMTWSLSHSMCLILIKDLKWIFYMLYKLPTCLILGNRLFDINRY